jgi:hypothetical protein
MVATSTTRSWRAARSIRSGTPVARGSVAKGADYRSHCQIEAGDEETRRHRRLLREDRVRRIALVAGVSG